jgi:hypothetical protein
MTALPSGTITFLFHRHRRVDAAVPAASRRHEGGAGRRGDAKYRDAARAEIDRARDSLADMGAIHDRVLAEQLLKD